MKRIHFNTEVDEVEAPDTLASSNSRTLGSNAELDSIPSLPSRSHTKRGVSVTATARRSPPGTSLPTTSSTPDRKGNVAPPQKKRKASVAQGLRVVTGFRGAIIPEYKGHMPRVGHVAFVYQRNFYIFGGINAKGQYSSYLFCHEKRSLQWEEVRSVGLIPSGRANLSAIQYDNKLVIYGGNRQLEVFDDLYSYDLDNHRWEKIGYERSQGPGPVFLHTAVHVPLIHSMIVLGGFHQREHNMYLGHAFDLRNRVWSGLPGPRAINPQHIQLVAASYYDPKQSLVVIGLVERDIRELKTMPAPSVYLMNVHSWVWTKVNTVASPESPIPFQMDVVWDYFARQLVTMGGFYEEGLQTWYFPLNLEPIEQGVLTRGSDVSGGISRTGSDLTGGSGGAVGRPKSRATQYGFFKLSMQEMSWSMVPINLPRRLGNTAPAGASTNSSNAVAQPVRRATKDAAGSLPWVQKQVLGDLNLDGVAGGSFGGGEGASRSSTGSAGRNTLTGFSPADVRAALAAAGDASPQQQQTALFTVQGEPQLQRKYAFAAYRDPQTSGRRKPMQYLIMHGGLQTDASPYSLLMFTPFISRADAHSAQKAARQSVGSAANMDESASFSTFVPDASRSFDSEYSMPFDDSDPVLALAEQERRIHEERQGCLLPVLPCARTAANEPRFAVLYHANNSMQSNRALPYSNTPAAVLERPEDVMQWSTAFYKDKRRWLAEKLKVAITEDRRLRRGTRRQIGSQSRATGGGSGEAHDDPDDDDDDELRFAAGGTLSRPSSSDSRPRSSGGVGPRGSTTSVTSAFDRSGADVFDGELDGPDRGRAANGVESDTGATGGHTDDFFKAKGLEPFVVEIGALGISDTRASTSGDLENPFLEQDTAMEVVPAGLERLWMKVKRHGEQQRLPTAVFRGAGTVNDGTMTGDLGSAMAFLLLRSAVAALPAEDTPEKRSRRAQLRWRFLRALVSTGEAAFIIYRANQRDARTKGQTVTGYPGLVMAPELLLVGATRAHKVPTRPVPYTIARPATKKTQFAEVTKSGMVAYHNMRHVK